MPKRKEFFILTLCGPINFPLIGSPGPNFFLQFLVDFYVKKGF